MGKRSKEKTLSYYFVYPSVAKYDYQEYHCGFYLLYPSVIRLTQSSFFDNVHSTGMYNYTDGI